MNNSFSLDSVSVPCWVRSRKVQDQKEREGEGAGWTGQGASNPSLILHRRRIKVFGNSRTPPPNTAPAFLWLDAADFDADVAFVFQTLQIFFILFALLAASRLLLLLPIDAASWLLIGRSLVLALWGDRRKITGNSVAGKTTAVNDVAVGSRYSTNYHTSSGRRCLRFWRLFRPWQARPIGMEGIASKRRIWKRLEWKTIIITFVRSSWPFMRDLDAEANLRRRWPNSFSCWADVQFRIICIVVQSQSSHSIVKRRLTRWWVVEP